MLRSLEDRVVLISVNEDYTSKSVDAKELKDAFSSIKDEFDDHLSAINGNTVEIKENDERLNLLDLKIEKLSEKIESVYMMLSQTLNQKDRFKDILLSNTEQKVFLAAYLENGSASYTTLSKKLGMKRPIIKMAIDSLRKKNIPFFVEKKNNDTYAFMETGFRELQAKEQVILIDEQNVKNLYVKDLRYFF